MNKKLALLLSAGALVAGAQQSQAVTFEGSAVGSWDNVTAEAGTTYSISNADAGAQAQLVWGLPLDRQSSFSFDGVGSDGGAGFSTTGGSPFSLGEFDYANASNLLGTSQLTGADLDVLVSFSNPAGIDDETYTFNFNLTITPNTGTPAQNADIVTVTPSAESSSFTYNGVLYTVEVLGFSTDGGVTIVNNFTTQEGLSNGAELYARIVGVSVPDGGATAMLLGLGVLGLAGLRRKLS